MTAKVAIVSIGQLKFEGLLLENNEYAIAQQQVASVFSVIPESAPKWLKRYLEEGFQLFQIHAFDINDIDWKQK